MERYRKAKTLGRGSFGSAILVRKVDDNRPFVIKRVDTSRMGAKEKQETQVEIDVISHLSSPCIVKYVEHFTYKKFLCIVMEYADGGDLGQKIEHHQKSNKYIAEDEILNLLVQVCMGLKHMHDRKILHRDLKSANIFLTKTGMVKLGDFGISRVLTNTTELASTAVGTPYYLSPEIVENKKYDHKSDVWAIGVVTYELAALKVPFTGNSFAQLVIAIARGAYPAPPKHYSASLGQLIAQMLQHNAKDRPSVNKILRGPLMKRRIQSFFGSELMEDELNHTVLHGRVHAPLHPKRALSQQSQRKDSSPPKPPVPDPRGGAGQQRAQTAEEQRKQARSSSGSGEQPIPRRPATGGTEVSSKRPVDRGAEERTSVPEARPKGKVISRPGSRRGSICEEEEAFTTVQLDPAAVQEAISRNSAERLSGGWVSAAPEPTTGQRCASQDQSETSKSRPSSGRRSSLGMEDRAQMRKDRKKAQEVEMKGGKLTNFDLVLPSDVVYDPAGGTAPPSKEPAAPAGPTAAPRRRLGQALAQSSLAVEPPVAPSQEGNSSRPPQPAARPTPNGQLKYGTSSDAVPPVGGVASKKTRSPSRLGEALNHSMSNQYGTPADSTIPPVGGVVVKKTRSPGRLGEALNHSTNQVIQQKSPQTSPTSPPKSPPKSPPRPLAVPLRNSLEVPVEAPPPDAGFAPPPPLLVGGRGQGAAAGAGTLAKRLELSIQVDPPRGGPDDAGPRSPAQKIKAHRAEEVEKARVSAQEELHRALEDAEGEDEVMLSAVGDHSYEEERLAPVPTSTAAPTSKASGTPKFDWSKIDGAQTGISGVSSQPHDEDEELGTAAIFGLQGALTQGNWMTSTWKKAANDFWQNGVVSGEIDTPPKIPEEPEPEPETVTGSRFSDDDEEDMVALSDVDSDEDALPSLGAEDRQRLDYMSEEAREEEANDLVAALQGCLLSDDEDEDDEAYREDGSDDEGWLRGEEYEGYEGCLSPLPPSMLPSGVSSNPYHSSPGETLLEASRREAAQERQVAPGVETHEVEGECQRLKARLQREVGKREFEVAYRIVAATEVFEEDDEFEFMQVIGMDRLYLLPLFQDLQALEEELSKRL